MVFIFFQPQLRTDRFGWAVKKKMAWGSCRGRLGPAVKTVHTSEGLRAEPLLLHIKGSRRRTSDFWLACRWLPGEASCWCAAAWTEPGPAAGTTFPTQPWSICAFWRSWGQWREREDGLSGCADTANPATKARKYRAWFLISNSWWNGWSGRLNLTELVRNWLKCH